MAIENIRSRSLKYVSRDFIVKSHPAELVWILERSPLLFKSISNLMFVPT